MAVIEAIELRRTYRTSTGVIRRKPLEVEAVRGISFAVEQGELFGLLGPNGAGKTTLIKILTTLLAPTSGTAKVFGFDVEHETKRIRRIMNMVAGGEQSGYGILTVREQLWMFSQFYGMSSADGWKRSDALLERVGLGEKRLQRVSTLSTGERQKMNLARGLMNDPWILFLDEPTLGLDVEAARSLRELMVEWRAAVPGRTILLTTHYMAEADELCDRIAIVHKGRILAIGTSAELKRRVQRESIFRVELDRLEGGVGAIAHLPGVVKASTGVMSESQTDRQAVAVNLVLEEDGVLGAVVGALSARGSRILGLQKSEPTLEDVFVELVGRGFEDEDEPDEHVDDPEAAT
jgi:ABC-2 type transport system ATP-binding protein